MAKLIEDQIKRETAERLAQGRKNGGKARHLLSGEIALEQKLLNRCGSWAGQRFNLPAISPEGLKTPQNNPLQKTA
jgi:hypothetical protein